MKKVGLFSNTIISIIFFLSSFFIFLSYTFRNFLVLNYTYQGFELSTDSSNLLSISLFLFIVTLIVFSETSYQLYIQVTFSLLTSIPILVLTASQKDYPSSVALISVLTQFLFFFFSKLFKGKGLQVSPQFSFLKRILFFATLSSLGFVFFYFGLDFNYRNLLLEEIYETRLSARSEGGRFYGYVYPILVNVLLPIALIRFKQNRHLVFLILVSYLYLFLTAAHKSTLFTPVIILVISSEFLRQKKQFLFFAFGIVFLLVVLVNSRGLDYLNAIVTRRVFFMPALLHSYYFEYFQNNYLYLSHTFFGVVNGSKSSLNPAFEIGERYFGSSEIRANAGFISDGFLNLGLTGAVLWAFGYSSLLVFLGWFETNKKYFGILLLFMMKFNNTSPLTVFMTHGFWLCLFILLFYQKKLLQGNRK